MASIQEISVDQAQATLPDLIHQLASGDVIIITDGSQVVARLVPPEKVPERQPRKPGSAVGKLRILVEDDEHLRDFRDYTE